MYNIYNFKPCSIVNSGINVTYSLMFMFCFFFLRKSLYFVSSQDLLKSNVTNIIIITKFELVSFY